MFDDNDYQLMAKVTRAILEHEAKDFGYGSVAEMLSAMEVSVEQDISQSYFPTTYTTHAHFDMSPKEGTPCIIKALTMVGSRWYHQPVEAFEDAYGNVWCKPGELW